MEICNKDNCTGCFACYNICPKHCIEMIQDERGHIFPHIDESRCIHCGSCRRVCMNNHEIDYHEPEAAYALWRKDTDDRAASTSGGLAAALAEWILNQDGVVFGAVWDENEMVHHMAVTQKKDMGRLRGSKYVHSYVQDTYTQCKRYLIQKKKVLFIGTGCQIEGLIGFLGRDYENLYTADLVCDGVPSHRMLREHMESVTARNDFTGLSVSFRNKTLYQLTIKEGDKILYSQPIDYDLYLRVFGYEAGFRDSCYRCLFARKERVGDVTIGDFWGLKADVTDEEKKKGISLLLVNTEKGRVLFDGIKKNCNYMERPVEEAVAGNGRLREAAKLNPRYDLLKKEMAKGVLLDEAANEIFGKEIRKLKLKESIKQFDKTTGIPLFSLLRKGKHLLKGH